jgi:hypothetical protein
MGTWVSTSLMQVDMGFTYMGILIVTPYMHGNMGFTYMGIFGFHHNTWMATWGSPS